VCKYRNSLIKENKMKLKLHKKKLKNLSNDKKSLPVDITPKIGGGALPYSHPKVCATNPDICDTTGYCF